MLRLAKAFLDIALWRKSPAQLPASAFLLGLVAFLVALLEIIAGLLPPNPSHRLLTRVALSVGLPLLFTWVVLRIAHRPQRFLQTGSALLGIAVFAQLLIYPIGALLEYVGADRLISLPLGLLLFLGMLGYLFACAHIWRMALDAGVALGAAVSIGYLLLSMALEQRFLTQS
ncbi:MAG TPA: hypothetical protein VKT22_12420 [Steroidobacteraceae bacterium]|nr:hypothetical protein [Steroidobacteraceae bacterium]